jgi:hypothetical protein
MFNFNGLLALFFNFLLFVVYLGGKMASFAQLIPVFSDEQVMHVDSFIDAVDICSNLACRGRIIWRCIILK